MSEFQRMAPGVLIVGKPLPWPVYDDKGSLLLNQGYVIQSESQLEQLYNRGLFQARLSDTKAKIQEDKREGRRVSPFAEYGALLDDLKNALTAVMEAQPNSKEKILGLARRINTMCHDDEDASLALPHIYAVEPTAYEQTLFYAILARFIAKNLHLNARHAMVLMASALTANLALLPHQDKLNNSAKRLSPEQRQVINKHPLLSVIALKKAGIDNGRLLRTVAQHHERHDGSGYPKGLRGDEILPEARALALAERYTAMITRRAYRDRYRYEDARAEILETATDDLETGLYQALFQELDPYPPGSLVKLRNGETAVITRRRKNRPPEAKAVISTSGNPFMGGFYRDTEEEDFAIEGTVVPEILPALNLPLLWGYG